MAKRSGVQRVSMIVIDGVEIEVTHKAVKNLRISVHPPEGQVRVGAPLLMSESFLQSAVRARLVWIRQKQALLTQAQPVMRPTYSAGETHYFLGHPYRLNVLAHKGPAKVCIRNEKVIDFFVREGSAAQREKAFQEWYRAQLRVVIPLLLDKWQPIVGVTVKEWGIKRMKTRWGTCNVAVRRIWLNLELAKKPFACLEYVVVHELVHLLEGSHNARFWGFMDQFLPEWRISKKQLNQKNQ